MPDGLPTSAHLRGKRVAFVGKLGGLNRREAQQLVRKHGGTAVDMPAQSATAPAVDIVVVGAEELPSITAAGLLTPALRTAAEQGTVEILGETQFWQRLGLLGECETNRQLYTPAMLAELLGVAVATVRRWHRRGLIRPVREVHRLPYFDYQEVSNARRIAQLLASGTAPEVIEQKLAELSQFVPDVQRPLDQLHVIVEGRRLLLRQGEGLIDTAGQFWIDFESLETARAAAPIETLPMHPATMALPADDEATSDEDRTPAPQDLLEQAELLEDEGRLELAAEHYRAALAAGGPNAQVCFQLAELLYRMDDVSASRERYYMALELDEDFVEARANLGCVLAQLGQLELAVAAFRGALGCHPDYPDVHYHLARTLDDLQLNEQAEIHWQRFLELAPESPWAEHARKRGNRD